MKCGLPVTAAVEDGSSPSRGTWIEIFAFFSARGEDGVVPLTGDVD